ncbi:MAG: hypothetical protein Q9174_005459 [Haloplaca sp. 1 TL-2023]
MSTTKPEAVSSWKVNLENKVIARELERDSLLCQVTGANQGIGAGIAEVCLANEAKIVYSLDINVPGADFSESERRVWIKTDVTKKESVDEAIEQIYLQQGRLDGFIANAGMTKHQPALDFSEEQLHQIFDLNRWIEEGHRGSIVFTASMTSYRPNRAAPSAPYGGTKAAIRNMAHTLAMEWAQHNIRVNSVSPGFVRTQMTAYLEDSPDWELKKKYYGGMPRLADPKELGGAYVYLLSDAASYTTGIDIPLAGIVGAW